jgi:3-hydroxyisobutyrate dehydrogenase-like beta-hydroxyacid dehydrogenase
VPSLREALAIASHVICICPPDSAVETAHSVAKLKFRGIYVDANALAPATTRDVGAIVETNGATFVDGGIIGLPPTAPGVCRLYLSGAQAGDVARLFERSVLDTVVLDGGIGAASALKMCYAAWNKMSLLLLASVRAVAEHEGVQQALMHEWRITQPALAKRLDYSISNARKAWRWSGEMEQIASTFSSAGVPPGFPLAAAEICRRLSAFKDQSDIRLEQVVAALSGDAISGAVAARRHGA